MLISTKSMPTKGILTPEIEEIEINPLTYKQLMKYTNEKKDNDIARLVHDIKYIITDINYWDKLSAFDLSSIIFTRKYISATPESRIIVTLDNERYSINVPDISFKTLNTDILKIDEIKLCGESFKFHVPTIGEYYELLKTFMELYMLNENWVTPGEIMILSSLGCTRGNTDRMFNMLANAKGDDVVTIKYLDLMLNDTVNDITLKSIDKQGGETVVNISKFITDIFRFILLNRPINLQLFKFK